MIEVTSIQSQPIPRDELRARGITPSGMQLLEAALGRGKISPFEIAHVLPQGARRDPELLKKTITWLGQLFSSRQVGLVTDKDEPEHRIKNPIPVTLKDRRFRQVERSEGNLVAYKDSVIPLDRLDDEKTGQFQDPLREYYQEMRGFKLLTPIQEMELGRRVLEDSDLGARNKLIEHNLRLVVWIARKYLWSKIELEDLVQEGNIGLMTAASKYDYRVGRFTTYATWWIRQAVTRMIMNYGTIIRLPVHIQELRMNIFQTSQALGEKLGRPPTLEEISTTMGIPKEKVRRCLLRTRIETISLNDTQDDVEGDGPSFAESIEDTQAVSPEIYIEARDELKAAEERMNTTLRTVTFGLELSERDQQVFSTFYGLDASGHRKTLEAVGQVFNITRERIRQIISRIWEKIDERGGDMDHARFLEEFVRIDELRKIVEAKST